MALQEIESTARALVARGKGILAADESTGTIKKRFDAVGLESTEDARRAYREMLFTTPGIEEFISGVILYDETIRQNTRDGKPLREVLMEKGIIPGIKVDKGAKDMPCRVWETKAPFDGAQDASVSRDKVQDAPICRPVEKLAEGLDGLRDRLAEYREMGARFTKWRAVIAIGDGIPTRTCIDDNGLTLALFAALSQEAGLVPIVEPEVLMDGDHDIDACAVATRMTLHRLFDRLLQHGVALEGLLLKTNMVLPGKDCSCQASVEQVARTTIQVLREVVPPAVPGVMFLSGGQSSELATEHLNAMNAMGSQPWELGFSYARALQDTPLKIWKGEDSNVEAAQRTFLHRARLNSAARLGVYSKKMEQEKEPAAFSI